MDHGWQHAFVLGVAAVAAAWLIRRVVRRRGARPCGAGRHGCVDGHAGADGFVAVERLSLSPSPKGQTDLLARSAGRYPPAATVPRVVAGDPHRWHDTRGDRDTREGHDEGAPGSGTAVRRPIDGRAIDG